MILAFIIWVIYYIYIYPQSVAWTDDAYVTGHYTVIAPRISGPIISVAVKDNQYVKKGDILLKIDPVNYQITLDRPNQSKTVS